VTGGPADRDFAAFAAERSTALLRTAYLLTGGRGAAHDLLQIALVAVHRRWRSFADREEATAAARRELVAAHVGWRARIRLGDLLADSPLLAGTAGLPGFGPPPGEAPPRGGLLAALAGLPPRPRAALVLRYGDGLSEAATADALGGGVADVAGSTEVGLARLRTTVEPAPADDDALVRRLRLELPLLAADVVADPRATADLALDGARYRRGHVAGLVAVGAFLLVVALLVVLTS